MMSRAYRRSQPTRSHYDVILTVTAFATELATPTVPDVHADTLPRLIAYVKIFQCFDFHKVV